jgi:hypothetical protein
MASEALSLLSLLYPIDEEDSAGPRTDDSVNCTGARTSLGGVTSTPGGVDVRKYSSCNPRYVTQARALCGAAMGGK